LSDRTSTLTDVDWDQDGAADDAEKEEHVSTHVSEPQEDSGIQPNSVCQNFLFRLKDWRDPREEAIAHWRRGVFLVSMFDFRGVDDIMMGSEDREKEG
jgi:hypothetical protein